MSGRLRLAVFDCDGTLVDSQHSIVHCMTSAFGAAGLAPPSADRVRRIVGLPLVEAVAQLAPALPPAECARIAELYKDAFFELRRRDRVDEPLFPGIVAALDALAAEGVLLGVATGKGIRGLRITLERHGLTDRFVTLQTPDDQPGKPDPAMLRRALAETGVAADDAVMIGDTSFDMAMARRAACGALGVSWGYHPVEELHASGAHAVLDHAHEIRAAVAALVERARAGAR